MKLPYKDKVLKNEININESYLKRLFSENNVYVFGYGSLLCSSGWSQRNIKKCPKKEELLECDLMGFERGPWGIFRINKYFNGVAFYGLIRKEGTKTNGVLVKINDLRDWIGLMVSEVVAGFGPIYNYRVVDITQEIIKNQTILPSNSVVHTVVNEPNNRKRFYKCRVPKPYYKTVWEGVEKERSQKFKDAFLKLGGFTHDSEVEKLLINIRQEKAQNNRDKSKKV